METRLFPSIGAELSLLGYGCMRFPTLPDGKIDRAESERLLTRAHGAGVNYFDTGWGYHGGESEPFLGTVLSKWDRSSYFLATKLPCWLLKDPDDPERFFSRQLERCRVDYFDFYLAHSITEKNYEILNATGACDYLARQKAEGKIRRLGFSFHDRPELLERMLTEHDWDFVQLQLNYLDWDFQGARAKAEELNRRHIPIWVMEPLRGGRLARLSDGDAARLAVLRPEESMPGWAFRFLQGVPGVTMVLSGMSSLEQLRANLDTFETDRPLSEAEKAALLDVAAGMVREQVLPCTACRYCVDHCPRHLDIPGLLALYNEHTFTGGGFIAPMAVEALPEEKRPAACIGCRSCEAVCPQQLKISEALADFARKLG